MRGPRSAGSQRGCVLQPRVQALGRPWPWRLQPNPLGLPRAKTLETCKPAGDGGPGPVALLHATPPGQPGAERLRLRGRAPSGGSELWIPERVRQEESGGPGFLGTGRGPGDRGHEVSTSVECPVSRRPGLGGEEDRSAPVGGAGGR